MTRGAGREASASAFETRRRSRRRLGNPPRDFNWVQLVEEGGVEGVGDVRGGRLRDPARSRRAVPREALHEERGGVARDGAGRVRDANERRVRGGGEGAGRRRRIRNPRRAAALPRGGVVREEGVAEEGPETVEGEVGRDARERRGRVRASTERGGDGGGDGGGGERRRRAEASREGVRGPGPARVARRGGVALRGERDERDAAHERGGERGGVGGGRRRGGPGGGVAIEGERRKGGARRRARRERGDELADERVRVERAGRRERCRGAGDLVHDRARDADEHASEGARRVLQGAATQEVHHAPRRAAMRGRVRAPVDVPKEELEVGLRAPRRRPHRAGPARTRRRAGGLCRGAEDARRRPSRTVRRRCALYLFSGSHR